VPVRIRNGAEYTFVEIPGVTSGWHRDPFFNRRLQMATTGDDRILLVAHRGGDLQLTLRRRPPIAWLAVAPTRNALDEWLVIMADRRHGGDVIALALAAIAALAAAVRIWRRRIEAPVAAIAAAIGVLAGILHMCYGLARVDEQTVINKDIAFSLLAPLATCVLAGCGAFLFLTARSRWGRLFAAVVPTAPGWAGGTIALGIATVTNAAIASAAGTGVWIYRVGITPFVLCLSASIVCWFVFSIASRSRAAMPCRDGSPSQAVVKGT
jgi:succinate dehydrogenase hydrophobic anchor subunit